MLFDLYSKEKRNGLEIGSKKKGKLKMMETRATTLTIEQEDYTNKLKTCRSMKISPTCLTI